MSSLITLPIRLPLEITFRAAKLGVDVLRAIAGLLERDEGDEGVPPPTAETVVVTEPPEPPEPAEPVVAPVDFDSPGEVAPRHVDSEPTLSYESGPAEDVGPTVHVEAPWEGYDRMRATQIVARLRSADAATKAIVRLYEQQGKARSSVLAATS